MMPHDEFHNRLRICNAMEAKYIDDVNLVRKGKTAEQADIKLKLPKPQATRVEK